MLDDHAEQPTPKTQLTQPKAGEPIEIPVPKEDDFEKLIGRAVPNRSSKELRDAASGSDD